MPNLRSERVRTGMARQLISSHNLSRQDSEIENHGERHKPLNAGRLLTSVHENGHHNSSIVLRHAKR